MAVMEYFLFYVEEWIEPLWESNRAFNFGKACKRRQGRGEKHFADVAVRRKKKN